MRDINWAVIIACLIIVVVALAGCSSTPPTNAVTVQCIPLKTWTAKDNDDLLAEYDALPRAAKLRSVFKDYIAMRDADKACIKAGAQ